MVYSIVDGAYVVTGAAEVPYIIGTNAEAAVKGSWGYIGDGILNPAKKVTLVPDTNACYVRIISLDYYVYAAQHGLNVASSVQIPLAVNQKYEFDNVLIIYYQRNAVADGNLSIVAQA